MQRVRWGLWWRYLFAVRFKYFCFSSGSLCIDVPIIIIKKSLFQTVVGILGIDYTFRQRNFGIYFNIQYIYTIFCISTHTSTTQIHLLRQAWLFLPDVTIFFKLKLQKLYDVWDFGSAIRSLGKQEGKKKKNNNNLRIWYASLRRWCLWWQMTIKEGMFQNCGFRLLAVIQSGPTGTLLLCSV